MLVALKATHAAAQELVVEAWRAHFEPFAPGRAAAMSTGRRRRSRTGSRVFADRLAASRQATEAALSLGERRGDEAADRGREGTKWRGSTGSVPGWSSIARGSTRSSCWRATDAPAAGRFLEEHVEPHYSEVMLPLIQRYRDDAQAELDAVVEDVDAALAASDRRNQLAAAGGRRARGAPWDCC